MNQQHASSSLAKHWVQQVEGLYIIHYNNDLLFLSNNNNANCTVAWATESPNPTLFKVNEWNSDYQEEFFLIHTQHMKLYNGQSLWIIIIIGK